MNEQRSEVFPDIRKNRFKITESTLGSKIPEQNNREPSQDPQEKQPTRPLVQLAQLPSQSEQVGQPASNIQEKQSATEMEIIDAQPYFVQYVPKDKIWPAFGYAGGNTAVVREDLPLLVKRFVTAHELYHLSDKGKFGGWVGSEIRANLIPGLKDPIGLAATIWATITDTDRIKFYVKRIREGQ